MSGPRPQCPRRLRDHQNLAVVNSEPQLVRSVANQLHSSLAEGKPPQLGIDDVLTPAPPPDADAAADPAPPAAPDPPLDPVPPLDRAPPGDP